MIKVGVIGVGTMGKHHARVYAGLSDVELVSVADVNEDVVHEIADTVENARRIIKSADKNGVTLMIGHIERFNPIIPVIQRGIGNSDIISIDVT
ncbi:MAG: hypothetical protein WBB67_01560, partial [bacterium]